MTASEPGECVYLIVDPVTREALRSGEDPATDGPLFFSSPERLSEYAEAHGIGQYTVHSIPAGVLTRMKNHPYWLDGRQPPTVTSTRRRRPTGRP